MKAYKQSLVLIYESTLEKCELTHNDVIKGNFKMKLNKYTFQNLRDMRYNIDMNQMKSGSNFKNSHSSTALLELVTELND